MAKRTEYMRDYMRKRKDAEIAAAYGDAVGESHNGARARPVAHDFYKSIWIRPAMTCEEIGKELGLSRSLIAEIEHKALEKIRMRLIAERKYSALRESLQDLAAEHNIKWVG